MSPKGEKEKHLIPIQNLNGALTYAEQVEIARHFFGSHPLPYLRIEALSQEGIKWQLS